MKIKKIIRIGRTTDGNLLKPYSGTGLLFCIWVSLKGLSGSKKEHMRLGREMTGSTEGIGGVRILFMFSQTLHSCMKQ